MTSLRALSRAEVGFLAGSVVTARAADLLERMLTVLIDVEIHLRIEQHAHDGECHAREEDQSRIDLADKARDGERGDDTA